MKSRLQFQRGFTLAEMLVAVGIGSVVIAGTMTLFVTYLRFYNSTSLMRNCASRASLALERMVYGVGANVGLRAAQSSTVSVTYPSGGWRIQYNTNLVFQYTVAAKTITDQANKIICSNVISSTLTYPTNSCTISLTVVEVGGGRIVTNTMASTVQFRN